MKQLEMNMVIRSVGMLLAAAVLIFAGGSRAGAQTLDAPKIAIVDVQRVLNEAKASKGVLPEIEKLRRDFQNQVKEEERALREAEQELSQQRAILSPDAFAQKRRDFSEKASDAQRVVQERRRALDQAFNATRNAILENLAIVSQNIAKERGLNIVMDKKFVFISANSLDITSEVITRLDKRLPSVKIEVGKGKGGKN